MQAGAIALYRRSMRAIWKGAISFGLVNVPIRLYSATEDHDVDLHQVHDEDGGRIRYERRCEKCGKVVEYAHIDKAFAEGSTTVVLTEEDLKSLPEERSREIEVVEFVPSEQIDPIMFDRSYFLEPEKVAVKAYARCFGGPSRRPTVRPSCSSRCARRLASARCAPGTKS